MSNKTITILVAVLVALAAIWGATAYLPKLTSKPSLYAGKIKSYDKNSVRLITIKDSSGSIELKKEGGVWRVNEKNADTSKINGLIDELFPIVSPEVIAQTDKRHKEFGLTQDMATSVALDNKLTWLIGKSVGAFVYARFDNDNNVYMLKSGTVSPSVQASDWYDKTILNFDQAKASKIVFKEVGRIITLIKKGDKWVEETRGNEVKNDKVNDVISQVSSLSAQSLYDSKKSGTYPVVPALTLIVEYDGRSETLEFSKGSSDYLVKRLSDGERFVVDKYAISSIVSGPKEVLN
jgi:hypothetical protein